VEAVASKPVNVILVSPKMKASALKELETASWAAFEAAAKSLSEAGALPAASFG
jgi:hypothetical protein